MKSTLRFESDVETCLSVLKENTSIGGVSNFLSFMNSKSFYGKFKDDDSFMLYYTTNYRGSFGFKIIGEITEIEHEKYRTKIEVETIFNKMNYVPLIIFGVLLFLVAGFPFFLLFLFFVILLKALTESNERKAINKIIDLLEK